MAIAWATPQVTPGAGTAKARTSSAPRRLSPSLTVTAMIVATALAGFGVAAALDGTEKAARIDTVTTDIRSTIDDSARLTLEHESATSIERSAGAALEQQLADQTGALP